MTFYCNGKEDVCECDILCADCEFYDNSGGKKIRSNADRIRAMSDEELAEFLEGDYGNMAVGWALEWLKQPVEDKNEN